MRILRVLALVCLAIGVQAQVSPWANPHIQLFSSTGVPLAGGKIYTYAAGSSTPLATYSDASSTPNTNPITLDSGGYANVWLGPYAYKFVAKNAAGTTQWTIDNVSSLIQLSSARLGDLIVKSPWIDPRYYGTHNIGGNDNTGWQSTISQVSGAGWNGSSWGSPTVTKKIQCPSGLSGITQTIVYNGSPSYSLVLEGVANDAGGASGCTIVWNGADGGTALQLNGASDVILRNITISEGTGKLLYGIQIDAHNITQSGSPGSALVTLDHVNVRISNQAGAIAVAIGHPGCVSEQVSEVTIRDAYLTGDGTSGTSGVKTFCGGNIKNLTIDRGTFTGFGSGVYTSNIASFDVRSTLFLSSSDSDFNLNGSPLQVNLQGVRSEGSTRFITGSIPTVSGINIDGGNWAGSTPSDDEVIRGGANIHIRGWYCNNLRTGSTRCKVITSNPRHDGTPVTGDGVYSEGSIYINAGNNTATNWPFYDSSGNVLGGDPTVDFYAYYGLPLSFRSVGDWGGPSAGPYTPLTAYDSNAVNLTATSVREAGSTASRAADEGFLQMKKDSKACWRNYSGNDNTCLQAGIGAPVGVCKNGSMYHRQDGGTGSSAYICSAGIWVAIPGFTVSGTNNKLVRFTVAGSVTVTNTQFERVSHVMTVTVNTTTGLTNGDTVNISGNFVNSLPSLSWDGQHGPITVVDGTHYTYADPCCNNSGVVTAASPAGSTMGTTTLAGTLSFADSGLADDGVGTAFASLTDAATITWALRSVNFVNATVTLADNRTLNITNPIAGGTYQLKIVQDGSGSHTLTLGTGCTWKVSGGGSGAIALTATASAIDLLSFTYDGTNCYATLTKNFN